MASLRSVAVEAMKLSEQERVKLAHQLWESVSPPPNQMSEEEAFALACQRNREMDEDPGRFSLSHEEVMQAAKQAHP